MATTLSGTCRGRLKAGGRVRPARRCLEAAAAHSRDATARIVPDELTAVGQANRWRRAAATEHPGLWASKGHPGSSPHLVDSEPSSARGTCA
jgi:hypothetical protein